MNQMKSKTLEGSTHCGYGMSEKSKDLSIRDSHKCKHQHANIINTHLSSGYRVEDKFHKQVNRAHNTMIIYRKGIYSLLIEMNN